VFDSENDHSLWWQVKSSTSIRIGGALVTNKSRNVLVVGAGAAGIAAARELRQANVPFDWVEQNQSFGGIWNREGRSPVYDSTTLISSKRMTEFSYKQISSTLPDYLSKTQALAYLREVVDSEGIAGKIEFGVSVKKVKRQAERSFIVQMERSGQSEARTYSDVFVASGFHSVPNVPDWAKSSNPRLVHSRDYRNPDQFRNQRVLVVGAGNSGCEIASEVSKVTKHCAWSVRRGYHIIPKYIFGKPADEVGRFWKFFPRRIQQFVNSWTLRVLFGDPSRHGLPHPDHRIFDSHPIINSEIDLRLSHGELLVRSDVTSVSDVRDDSNPTPAPIEVKFAGCDTVEQFDSIILATGYRPEIPYVDDDELNFHQGHENRRCPHLLLNMVHPKRSGLVVIGLIQPDSGVWWLLEKQAKLAVRLVLDRPDAPDLFATGIVGVNSYLKTYRHVFEVDYVKYSRQLERLTKRLEKRSRKGRDSRPASPPNSDPLETY
jgi:hypothetical protein